jgi:predicted lipid-binding transport protein (Tim44 family)
MWAVKKLAIRWARSPWTWVLASLVVASGSAWARPGGGSSFSGHSSGGGGSSSDSIDLIFAVIELTVEYPQVMLPLMATLLVSWIVWRLWQSDTGRKVLGVVVVGGLVTVTIFWPPIGLALVGVTVVGVAGLAIGGAIRRRPPEWNTAIAAAPAAASVVRSPRRQLEAVRKSDPDFSVVVLEDFLEGLFVEAQRARAGGLERLQPYLKPQARGTLAGDLAEVKDIIVGALSVIRYERVSKRLQIDVEIESNLTEVSKKGDEQSYYLQQRWSLSRRPEAKSREPQRARIFTCPSCGAALESISGGTCTYCKQKVDTGDYDWIVEKIYTLSKEARGPILTEQAPEKGTDLPTVIEANLQPALGALAEKDPAFSQAAFSQRIRLVFETMQKAWSSRDWIKVRPYLSDRLFQAQLYWIEAYKRAHLRNLNQQTVITKIQLARVSSDKYFDGITVRLYAQGLDYVVDDDDQLVCGSKSEPRKYSEYWTFIRGAKVRGAPRVDPNCPNCQAPLDVNMAGNCSHCKARVTLGEFDWVLSRIEQDEVYGE